MKGLCLVSTWSGEHLIGTNVGVFRVATVRRKPADAKRSANRVTEMQGTPKQPVPGQAGKRAPAFARKFEARPPVDDQFVPQQPLTANIRNWKIMKADVDTHGHTEGCAGCRTFVRGSTQKATHSHQYCLRMRDLIMSDDYGRAKIERATERMAETARPIELTQPGGEVRDALPPSDSWASQRKQRSTTGESHIASPDTTQ